MSSTARSGLVSRVAVLAAAGQGCVERTETLLDSTGTRVEPEAAVNGRHRLSAGGAPAGSAERAADDTAIVTRP